MVTSQALLFTSFALATNVGTKLLGASARSFGAWSPNAAAVRNDLAQYRDLPCAGPIPGPLQAGKALIE